MPDSPTCTAFVADRRLAAGTRSFVAAAVTAVPRGGPPIVVIDDVTGRVLDLDHADLHPGEPAERVGPGRPRLGVRGREVTLLPRHWEWLERQPRGASATIRRLVELEMRRDPEGERARDARDATSRVLTELAGDRPGYEEASRALYAGDEARFQARVGAWPADVAAYVTRMAAPWFTRPTPSPA